MTIPIILGRPFLATGGALIDVREGTLKLRLNDRVYEALNTISHYRDLCMIIAMDMDKCGVEACKLPITSSSSLMEFAKLMIKLKPEKLEWNPEKVNVRKAADLECEHSRVQKRRRR